MYEVATRSVEIHQTMASTNVQHLSLQSSNASQSSSIQVENLQNYFGSLFSGFSISNFVHFIEKVSVFSLYIFANLRLNSVHICCCFQ